MKKTAPVLLAPILCLLAISLSDAQPQRERGHRGPNMAMMFEGLKLDEDQRAAIETIRIETGKKKARKRADIEVARLELQAMMGADEPERKKIHAQIEKIAGLEAQMRILEVDQQLDIRKLLTAEQRRRFEHMHMRMKHRQEDRRSRPHRQ